MEQLTLLSADEGTANLAGPREVVQAALQRKAELESALTKTARRPIQVSITTTQAKAAAPSTTQPTPARKPMLEHPLVRQAVDELGAVFVREAPRSRPSQQ